MLILIFDISNDCLILNNPNTVCLGLGYCTLPCLSDGDCVTGTCQTVQGSRTCLLYDIYETNETLSAISNLLLIEVSWLVWKFIIRFLMLFSA